MLRRLINTRACATYGHDAIQCDRGDKASHGGNRVEREVNGPKTDSASGGIRTNVVPPSVRRRRQASITRGGMRKEDSCR